MSITIKDIAKLAGVSHTTVSRALNNPGSVKDETREKILKLIKEHSYSPHPSARSLVSGKNHNIGLFISYDINKFPSDFLPSILAGMVNRLNKYGYNLSLFFDNINGKRNQVPLEMITNKGIDGVFILSVETEAQIAFKVGNIDLPLVLVNQKIDGLKLNYVTADDEGGAYQAVSHLLDLGHKRIAFIGASARYSTIVDRIHGYHRALKERGISVDSQIEKTGFFNQIEAYDAMNELLKEEKKITAVFAANDLMALGVMKSIKENGLRIPEDIAVVGFDDTEFSSVVDPPLTTIKKPRGKMGDEAARIMLDLLQYPSSKEIKEIILPTKLIIRQSSEVK